MSNSLYRRTGMNKPQRQAYMSKKADELADSGDYLGWHHIELALRAEGFTEARGWLDNSVMRNLLDARCKTAQAARERGQ